MRDAAEVEKLSKLWDANGLLCLIPASLGPSSSEKFLHTRVFGNFKNSNADRQMGDRRGRNFTEGRICEGPSHEIPNATSILQLEVKRFEEVLVGGIADRRDIYHLFAASYERASTNTVYPPFNLGSFKGLQAYDHFLANCGKRARKEAREETGDFLGIPRPVV